MLTAPENFSFACRLLPKSAAAAGASFKICKSHPAFSDKCCSADFFQMPTKLKAPQNPQLEYRSDCCTEACRTLIAFANGAGGVLHF